MDEIWGWYQSRGAEPTLRAAGGRAAGAVGGGPPRASTPCPPTADTRDIGGNGPTKHLRFACSFRAPGVRVSSRQPLSGAFPEASPPALRLRLLSSASLHPSGPWQM